MSSLLLLPLLGIPGYLAGGLFSWGDEDDDDKKSRWPLVLGFILAALIVVMYGVVSMARAGVYGSDSALGGYVSGMFALADKYLGGLFSLIETALNATLEFFHLKG